jgi:hypothetical protein
MTQILRIDNKKSVKSRESNGVPQNSLKRLDERGNVCIQYTVIQSYYAFRKEEKRI